MHAPDAFGRASKLVPKMQLPAHNHFRSAAGQHVQLSCIWFRATAGVEEPRDFASGSPRRRIHGRLSHQAFVACIICPYQASHLTRRHRHGLGKNCSATPAFLVFREAAQALSRSR